LAVFIYNSMILPTTFLFFYIFLSKKILLFTVVAKIIRTVFFFMF